MQILEPAWYVHGPTVVAEVTTDLAEHGRHRERQEIGAVLGVEAVHRVHQADAGDLHEVVEVLALAVVAEGDVIGQGRHRVTMHSR